MEKKKTHIRAEVDSEIKRVFEGAYRIAGLSYNEALEKAMQLFISKTLKPDVQKLSEGT